MMNGRNTEPHNGSFRANLGDLSHVPAKEFEMHFREWLERDDVARSLQAKLRADLILNFNKTALGKQLMSESASSLGGSTHRLTLSPLILALNTLVAEFLYAVNCHFSLSVFSTEVPFRNVLPDFESKRCFRFTEHEIVEIIEALSANFKCESSVKYKLAQTYRNSGTTSLLLLLVKYLMQHVCLKPDGGSPTRHSSSPLSPKHHHRHHSARRAASPAPSAVSSSTKTAPQDLKSEIYNTNFRYLNKYLIILCKKVKEMTDLLDHLSDKKSRYSGTSSSRKQLTAKSAPSRGKNESMNRSLETITKNLRELKASKRNDKQVGGLVAAIEALSGHFQKCAVNFDKLSHDFAGASKAPKECPAEKCPAGGDVAEKPYAEWVREMRHSANGRRFLDRVEASMSKALNKQRLHLEEETEAKLKHQKHLLKVHYRQKLIQKIDKRNQHEDLALQENVEQQLKQFESKHLQLLCKMQEAELEAIRLAKTESNASKVMSVIREKILDEEFPSRGSRLAEPACQPEEKVPVVPLIGDPVPVFSLKPVKVSSVIGKLTENTASQTEKLATHSKDVLLPAENIHNIVKGIVEHDRHVEEIIAGAKKRINELENVGSQLDQNFQEYLDRQKKQKDAAHEAALKMCRNYANERQKLREHINKIKEVSSKQPPNPNVPLIVAQQQTVEVPKQAANLQAAAISTDSSPAPEPRNAIKEAKEKFLNERSLSAGGPVPQHPRAPSPDGLEAQFINEKFMALPTLGASVRKGERPVSRQAQLSSDGSTKSTSSLSSSSSSSSSGNSLNALGVDVNISTPTSTTANTTSSPSSCRGGERQRGVDPHGSRHQLSSAGGAGNNSKMPEAANQNNSTSGINNVTISSRSSIANARCSDENNVNGTEMRTEFGNNNNTGERTNAPNECGMTTKALLAPRTGGMQQIKDNKRASGNHDGCSSAMAAPSPSTSSSLMHQQSMMKMKRLFASVLQPASPPAAGSERVFNNGVNDVEAVVVATTSSATRATSPAGRAFIGAAAAVGAATITVATVLTASDGQQQRLAGGKHLERASSSSSLSAAAPHQVVNNDVALRQLQRHGNTERNTNMSLDNDAPAAPPPEPDLQLCKRDETEVAAAAAVRPQGVQSINDSFVQSPAAAAHTSHSVKPMKMPSSGEDNNVADGREEEPGQAEEEDDDEVMLERAAEADNSSDVVSYEYTPDLSVNEDEDDKAGSSALQLKRTEAQTSFIQTQRRQQQKQEKQQQQQQKQQQQQQCSKSNSSEIKTALDRLIAGNDESEGTGKRRGATRTAARPGCGGEGQAAERSSSSISGSDFWK